MFEQKKNNELYHSDIYLGADFSEGLKHYKYMKRYKNSKGEWRYVYASDKVHQRIKKNQEGIEFNMKNVRMLESDIEQLTPLTSRKYSLEKREKYAQNIKMLKQFLESGKKRVEEWSQGYDSILDKNIAEHLAPGHERYLGNRKRTM